MGDHDPSGLDMDKFLAITRQEDDDKEKLQDFADNYQHEEDE